MPNFWNIYTWEPMYKKKIYVHIFSEKDIQISNKSYFNHNICQIIAKCIFNVFPVIWKKLKFAVVGRIKIF